MSEPGWVALDAELDRWTKGGMVATLWWRDDDAVAPSAELDRLLAIGGATIPIALAVIPAEATESLAARLSGMPRIFVLQHGYAHRNHRGAGERAAEFGGDRPQSVERDELERGLRRLALLFGDRLVPVFVPPWNRFDESLVATLQALGFTGLSSFGPRQSAGAGGMVRVNAHVDPIAWRRDRAFLGEEETLARLVRHLAARRTGQVDAAEPTGLLTHHRVHAPDLWNFLGRLADRIARHDSARWLRPDEIFAR